MTIWASRPADTELAAVIAQLEVGTSTADIETQTVDLKEEAGRRGGDGSLGPSRLQSAAAANALAEAVACMASSPGGGALIVGVDDKTHGLIGTDLDITWLRQRLYELLDRRVHVEISDHYIRNARLLILRIPEMPEPVFYKGRLKWRSGRNCVPITEANWRELHPLGATRDWSAQTSVHPIGDASPKAIEIARRFLRNAGKTELAEAADQDLLRLIGAVTGDDHLSHAGALAFIGRGGPALDYQRRDHVGGDSKLRVNEPGLSVLEELDRTLEAITAYNPMTHLETGLVHRQIPALPVRAIREAIVNGLAHRDWISELPTTVEHTGPTMTITSPGGFIGGVNEQNILSHISTPRNRALADLFQHLGIAEKQGIGVDRMVVDMLSNGYEPPVITQSQGPAVRVVLLGGNPDEEWIGFLSTLEPPVPSSDLATHQILDLATRAGWIDAASASAVLQRPPAEAAHHINQAVTHRLGTSTLDLVEGTPEDAPPAWTPSQATRSQLPARTRSYTSPARRQAVAMSWARSRSRISTTELASIVGIARQKAGTTLVDLEADGELVPSSTVRRGRGFHYRPA